MNRKYSKFLTMLLIVIIMAVIGLCGYLGYTFIHNKSVNKSGSDAVETFKSENAIEIISDSGVISPGSAVISNNGENSGSQNSNDTILDTSPTTNNQGNSGSSSSSTSAKKPTYKGFNVVGTIEIPKTKLSYPILEKVTKKSLENSVAMIYPFEDPEVNIVGNIVIVGHNYRNGTFFSNNKKISNGDSIYITGLDKKRVEYIVYNIFETTPEDASFYNRETNGKREITLSTCTDDATKRLIIQAKEK